VSEQEREPAGRSLTRREFDEVMRRASELASRETEGDHSELAESEVYRIAREVGLSQRYVRQALGEVRQQQVPTTLTDRIFGPERVRASRVIQRSPEELGALIDEFLVAGRLLQRVRRSRSFLQYRPAVDWISQLARAASATSKKYFVASARSVEVHLEPVDDVRTLVEFEVDPGIRGDYVGGLVLGGGAGVVGGGVGAGVGLALVAPVALAVVGGAVLAGGVGVFATRWAGRSHRRKALDVVAEIEGILDRLEGGYSLEPPPSSWRKWVERQFHGARRLLDPLDDSMDM
jgi:hypothetical protein